MLTKNKRFIIFFALSMFFMTMPVFATKTGETVNSVWNTAYGIIKEIGTPIATATAVCSAFYYFSPLGANNDRGQETAKKLIVGAVVGLLIIYLTPAIVNAIVNILESMS